MITKIEWTARVTVPSEKVDSVLEFAGEVERGLKASELVPEDARITKFDSFLGSAFVVVEWRTENEMEYTDNYKAS